MIRVCIVGANSYIGTAVKLALNKQPDIFYAWEIDATSELLQIENADVVLHVAGIAHQKETKENVPLYMAVNCDLALSVAKQAKQAGVRQFIFLSSMSVYGLQSGHITKETLPAPNTAYGCSKLAAEQNLLPLQDDNFHLAILRPPMIYGKGCLGNYPKLRNMLLKVPVFLASNNERSMLYIEILTDFITSLIQSGQSGLFFPQNKDYVAIAKLIDEISLANHKKIWQIKGFGWLINILAKHIPIFTKLFASLTYDKEMSLSFRSPHEISFHDTIERTER